jgi:hypothetical protein
MSGHSQCSLAACYNDRSVQRYQYWDLRGPPNNHWDYVFIAPGAVLCGNCRVEGKVFVRAGPTILPGVTVGAEATVLRSVRQGVAGVPGLELVRRNQT